MTDGRYEDLKEYLKSLGSVAVAYSGGTDSAFLLYAARQALGDNVLAITAQLKSTPHSEIEQAAGYCEELGISHSILEINELEIDGFAENPPDRCYICKRTIFGEMLKTAGRYGMNILAEGSNLDDEGDYRPGLRAIAELGVKSPLRDTGFTKNEIREVSRKLGIPVWNKPSAACLSSRIPYGELITAEKLKMADGAEQLLKGMGFTQVRVRVHGSSARIEILPEEFEKLLIKDIRTRVYSEFRKIGFDYVSMDICGFRTGSMNEALHETADAEEKR